MAKTIPIARAAAADRHATGRAEILRDGLSMDNTGCDCLNWCGDDPWIVDGRIGLCEWGAARAAEAAVAARLHAGLPEVLRHAQLVSKAARRLSPTSAAHAGRLLVAIDALRIAITNATGEPA